jgi:hypothetical protein
VEVTSVTFFDSRVADVNSMIAAHAPFGEVEDWIDGQPVGDDYKAALWLLAWSEQPRSLNAAIMWSDATTTLPPLVTD